MAQLASPHKAGTSPEGHVEACTRYDHARAQPTLPRVHTANPASMQTSTTSPGEAGLRNVLQKTGGAIGTVLAAARHYRPASCPVPLRGEQRA